MCDPHVGKILGIVQVAISYKEYIEMFTTSLPIDKIIENYKTFATLMEDHKTYIELLWENYKSSQLPVGKHIRYGDFYKRIDTSGSADNKVLPQCLMRENPLKHDNHWLIMKIAEELVIKPWGMGEYVQHRIVEILNVVVLDEPEEIDGFPLKDVYQLELIPDDTYYSGPPKISYEKRKSIVEYCASNNINMFYSWDFDKRNTTAIPSTHSYHSPIYASVVFEKSSDAMICKLKY